MYKLIRLLKETMAIKALSPEKAAPFIGCSGKQIRTWISGEVDPSPLFIKAIEAGIRKINREIPGDTPEGVVSWRSAGPVPADEIAVNNKVTEFLIELVKAARARGRSFTHQEDDNLLGFEETCLLAKRLKVKLPIL